MTPSELEKYLETGDSKKVGWKGKEGDDQSKESVGHQSGERIVEILGKHKADYTDDDYAHMKKVVGYVHEPSKGRRLRSPPQGTKAEQRSHRDFQLALLADELGPRSAQSLGTCKL